MQIRQMPPRRISVYLLLWVLTPLVDTVAVKTWYPNQIIVGYELLQVCLGVVLFRNFAKIVVVQARWIVILLLYSGTFIVVSYYGVDFATSVENFVLYEPFLILLPFVVAFSIGYIYPEERTFRYLMAAGLVLLVETLLEMQLLPDQTRFVSTLNLPMAIPIYVFWGHTLLALICVLVLLTSLKKTMVVIGLMSFVMAFLLKGYVRRGGAPVGGSSGKRGLVATIATTLVLLVAATVILMGYSSHITGTVGRFSEAEDVSRAKITYYSLLLLAQRFPWGIGWFGFLSQSIGVIPYDTTDQRGEIHSGANLHNSYMTWALEGGAPILLIVIYLFWKLLAVIRSFLRHQQQRLLGAILLIWLLGGMIFGAFQQWHMTDTFWQLFGFGFGCYARYRFDDEVDDSAPDSHP
jgi:hypothetical protein